MRPEDQDFEERLMAYLEGTLDPDALRAFDAFVRDDSGRPLKRWRMSGPCANRCNVNLAVMLPTLGSSPVQLQTSAASQRGRTRGVTGRGLEGVVPISTELAGCRFGLGRKPRLGTYRLAGLGDAAP